MIVCAHNEQEYIDDCLKSILSQTLKPRSIIVILDRCTDKTEEIVRSILPQSALIVRKDAQAWRNSISENLEIGRSKATGQALAIVDADMVIPVNFLEQLLPQLKEYSSVSARARTDPTRGFLNKLVSSWERTYRLAPYGRQPRGGVRVISMSDLNEIGGFHDVIAWDTDLDIRFRKSGHRVRLDPGLTVLHRRRMTLRRSASYQIQMGRARRELGVSFSRTLLHSLFRVRPFVVYGYIRGKDSLKTKNP